MPKAAKTPVKSRPKPRPVRSPAVIDTKRLLDDEAVESDDGVMVDRPDFEPPDEYPEEEIGNESQQDQDSEGGNGYEQDFINDGDPFEDNDNGEVREESPEITPPPELPKRGRPTSTSKNTGRYLSPAKSRRKAVAPDAEMDDDENLSATQDNIPSTPVKSERGKNKSGVKSAAPSSPSPAKRIVSKSAVAKHSKPLPEAEPAIEIETTSDEDLEAMDVDDSVYKRPTGLKPMTKQSTNKASEETSHDEDLAAGATSALDQESIDPDLLASIPEELRVPPFLVGGKASPVLLGWISALKHHKAEPSPLSTVAKKSTARPSKRVDHDQLALEQGVRSSMKVSSGTANVKATSKRAAPARDSPDWDPPSVGDLMDQAATVSPSRKKPRISKAAAGEDEVSDPDIAVSPVTPKPKKAVSSKKGKEKARSETPTLLPSPNLPSPAGKVGKAARGSQDTGSSSVKAKSKPFAVPKQTDDRDVSSYLTPSRVPTSSELAGAAKAGSMLTMSQIKRMSRGEPTIEEEPEPKEDTPPIEPDRVFLEDLESYKAYYDDTAPCGVFDETLQDVSLRLHYLNLAPLPSNRRIVPVYDRSRSSLEDIDWVTGGRVKYSSWFDQNPRMLASNSMGALTFDYAAPNFINLSRVSPLELSSRVSAGSSQTSRLYFGDRVAICVSAVCSTESHVVSPKRVGTKSELQRKWLSGVFHDQDYERFESIVCLVFGERIMYGQVTDKALSFQTMMSPDPARADASAEKPSASVPSTMFSTRSPAKRSTRSNNDLNKTLLAHNDPIPVYDARKTVIDFTADLDRLVEVLPLFHGEVPVGSFTVVGYTCSYYKRAINGSTGQVPHVGLNILWLIVCGTPGLRR
ncbi:hypothetical protein DFH06DRAFT_1343597 [Mycena polygramma]|nr:hypothetical protein DFH06DRAFT_1343597 [Mycena polygramma]